MSIEVMNEQFYVNKQPLFLIGAEMHYFRVPKEKWEDRLQKIKAAGCRLVSTYIPWCFHEKTEGDIDLTGRTLPEKDLQSFLDLTKKYDLLVLVRPGPYVMSEIKGHGLPNWLIEHYPDIVAKKIDGSNHVIVSYLNETYLSLVDKWYNAVFNIISPRQITNGGNIILCQLDNEVGMFSWIMNHPDYSDFIIERFIHFLEQKYNITDFQRLFCTNLTSIEEFVKTYLKKPLPEHAIILMNEYMLFHRDYFKEYFERLKGIAEKYGLNVPVIINVHGFNSVDYAKRGLQYPIGLSQLLHTAQITNVIIAGDYYVGNIVPDNFFDILLANAFTKAIQPKNQPLFSAEFQSGFQQNIPRLQPTTTDLKSRICIGSGMNAINYYMFVGGENYEGIGGLGRRHDWQAPIGMDGSLRPHYYLIKHLASVIKSYEKALLSAKYEIVLHLGFDPDYYMTEYDNNYTREYKGLFKRLREQILYNGIGKALTYYNIPFTGYNLHEAGDIDVKQVPILWVFSIGYMNEDVQCKLIKYVENGGQLIISPNLPIKDINKNDCTSFIDALDLDILENKNWQVISVDDIDDINCITVETYPVSDGFAYTESGKNVVGFIKQYGLGKVVVFGGGFSGELDHKLEAYIKVLNQLNIKSLIKTETWLTTFIRKGAVGTFLFINNLEEYDKQSRIYYDEELLFDGKSLKIPMRSGLILPLNWKVTDDLFIYYSTGEIYNLEESEIKISFSVKVIDKEWIKMETPLSFEVINGQVIHKEGNIYMIETNPGETITITCFK